jgi:hypothetical protein
MHETKTGYSDKNGILRHRPKMRRKKKLRKFFIKKYFSLPIFVGSVWFGETELIIILALADTLVLFREISVYQNDIFCTM